MSQLSLQRLQETSLIIQNDLSIINEFIDHFDDLTDRDFRNVLSALESLSLIGTSMKKPVRDLRNKVTLEHHRLFAESKLAAKASNS